jgi:uncharacterized protein
MLKTLFGILLAVATTIPAGSSPGRYHVLRLVPGQQLRAELIEYVAVHDLKAVSVVTAVGSLQKAELRLAGRTDALKVDGPLEVVSLVGTLGSGGVHLHLSVADAKGIVRGGHLLGGDPVYTTMELVIVELTDLEFKREVDAKTGFSELRVLPRK